MSFEGCFKVFSYLTVIAGFLAVSLGGGAGPFAAWIFGSVVIASWFVDTGRLRRSLPPVVPSVLTLVCMPLFLVDYVWLSRSFLISSVHLLMLLASILLLMRSSDRDLFWLYLISFAWLAAGAVLSVDFAFLLSLLLFIFSAVGTLILYEMRRSYERALRRGPTDPPLAAPRYSGPAHDIFARFPAVKMTWLFLAMAGTIVLLSIPLFLILPRVSSGFHGHPRGRTKLVSGFSESVELGQIGTIKESDSVVMKVRLNGQTSILPSELKWRGIALDFFDGRAWKLSIAGRSRLDSAGRYFKLEESARGPGLLLQTFFLEPLSTDTVFAASRVLAVSSNLGHLERDAQGGLTTSPHPGTRIRYEAVSDVTPVDAALVPREQGVLPGDVSATCLQVPAMSPKVKELSARITAAEPHPMRKAKLLEQYLRSGYRYSLRLKGSPRHTDPISSFLFEVREGHCEYFASAMVLMLRHIGIPARLVNGFRAGEYSVLGDAWIVRQYDAHSWVEAYFKPFGWIEFDPTPAEPRRPRSAVMSLASEIFEALDIYWWEGVVSYDIWKQSHMLGAALFWANDRLSQADRWASIAHERSRAAVSRVLLSPARITLALSLVASAAAFVLVIALRPRWARRLIRRLGRALTSGTRRSVIAGFYEEALELLESHGFSRNRSQTPLEFALSLNCMPASGIFTELTAIYYRARFGGSFTAGDQPRAEALLVSLRVCLRQVSGSSEGPAFPRRS